MAVSTRRPRPWEGSRRAGLGLHALAVGVCALGAVLGWALVSGCGSTPPGPAPSHPIVLRVGLGQPNRAAQVASLLDYAPLVTIGRDGRISPGLAERWEFSADGRLWRFTLRAGLRFADGSPLDATAAARAIDEARREPQSVPGLWDIVAVTTEGPTSLLVTLSGRSSLLLEALASYSITGSGDGEATAGPFRVTRQDRDQADLEAFDGYYRGRPHIDRVEVRGYPNARAAWAALMRDDIDFLYEVAPEAIEFIEAGTDVRAFSSLRPYVFLLGFNVARPTLRDARVRQALNLAIDKNAAIDLAFGGRGVAATGPVWIRHWTYDEAVSPVRHDPDAARALLEAAGWPTPGPGVGKARRGRLTLSCLVPAGYESFERLALVLQKQLLDVGVDLRLEAVPLSELAERLATGRFETFLFEQVAGTGLTPLYWFWHSPPRSAGSSMRIGPLPGGAFVRHGYTAADAALDRMRHAGDDEALRAAVREVQRATADDPPAVFLAWQERSRAVRRRFEIPAAADRDVLGSLAQWRLATETPR